MDNLLLDKDDEAILMDVWKGVQKPADDLDSKAVLIAGILYGIYGGEQLTKDHPPAVLKRRSHEGEPCKPGWTQARTGCDPKKKPERPFGGGRASSVRPADAAAEAAKVIAGILAGDDRTTPADLLNKHLKNLTVPELRALHAKVGKPMPKGLREKLIGSVKQMLAERRPITPTGEGTQMPGFMRESPLAKIGQDSADKTSDLFGLVRKPIRFASDDSGRTYGEHGKNGAVIVNASMNPINQFLNIPLSRKVSQAEHLAAHEIMHQVYSANSEVGKKMMERLSKVKAGHGSSVSIYGAMSGQFENLMELGAVYSHSPEDLKKYSPEMFAIADSWAKRSRGEFEPEPEPEFKVGDLVIVSNWGDTQKPTWSGTIEKVEPDKGQPGKDMYYVRRHEGFGGQWVFSQDVVKAKREQTSSSFEGRIDSSLPINERIAKYEKGDQIINELIDMRTEEFRKLEGMLGELDNHKQAMEDWKKTYGSWPFAINRGEDIQRVRRYLEAEQSFKPDDKALQETLKLSDDELRSISDLYRDTQKKIDDTRDASNKIGNSLVKKAHAILAAHFKGVPKAKLDVNPEKIRFNPEQKVAVKVGMDWIAQMLGEDGQFANRKVMFRKLRRNRASCSFGSGIINTSPHMNADTQVHEFGHWLETHHLGISEAAQRFLEYRVKDEKGRTMKSVAKQAGWTSTKGFKSNEIGRGDDFTKTFGLVNGYYVGKDYGRLGSEITSMGIELMFHDPVTFAQKDPEYFKYCLGVLDGTLRYDPPGKVIPAEEHASKPSPKSAPADSAPSLVNGHKVYQAVDGSKWVVAPGGKRGAARRRRFKTREEALDWVSKQPRGAYDDNGKDTTTS